MTAIITSATAAPTRRNPGWWMESQIKGFEVEYSSEGELKRKLSELLKEYDYALNKRIRFSPMYIDTESGAKHVGYVANIMIDVQGDDYKWRKGFFEVWISIRRICDGELIAA